jgi:diguanylate cyclase (GGDEF)-like protein
MGTAIARTFPVPSTLAPFLLGLLVTAGLLVPLILRLRGQARDADAHATAAEKQLADLKKSRTETEESQRALAHFLKEFPHAARDLFSGLTERQVPGALLRVLQRSLDPAQALVLVRRGQASENLRLVVAATYPEGDTALLNKEVSGTAGEVGFVVESQLVVTRPDLAAGSVQERIKPGPDALPGFRADLYAPLVFDQDTLGVIAVARPKRVVGDGKAALRLIAQTGAQALHAATSYSQVRVTAEVDGLTSAYNKRYVEQALSDLIYRTACAAYDRRSAGSGSSPDTVSIFLFDLDHFKHYNDTNGHLAGDSLLQDLARLVQASIRQDDIFGRFGGEEFLLIMPNTDLSHALAAANKLRGAIAARKFVSADKQPMGVISVSGGVAEYPSDGIDAPTLLRAADEALYEAKRQGRNRVVAAASVREEAARAAVPALPVPEGKPGA